MNKVSFYVYLMAFCSISSYSLELYSTGLFKVESGNCYQQFSEHEKYLKNERWHRIDCLDKLDKAEKYSELSRYFSKYFFYYRKKIISLNEFNLITSKYIEISNDKLNSHDAIKKFKNSVSFILIKNKRYNQLRNN